MEGTGLSLFQGSESLQLNSSAQREEEQEAVEDQRRRNKELENILTTAFDDLDDEDDGSSIVSDDTQHTPAYLSGGGDGSVSTHYKHCFRGSLVSSENLDESRQKPRTAQEQDDVKSREQLQVLYEVRVREIQRMSLDIDKWRRQVALREAEKERLQITLTQQANQLTAAQGTTADLEAEVATLKQNVLNSEKSKTLVAKELASYKTVASDLQTRVDSLLRGSERDSDALLSDAQEKLDVMQHRLDTTANNLALKTVEHERLLRKMADTARDYETLLAGNTETIDKLTTSLEASQKQVQLLKDAKELNGKLKEELERCIAGGRLKVDENKKLEVLLDKKEATIHALRSQESRDISQVNSYKDQVSKLNNECKRRQQREDELVSLNGQLEADLNKLKLDLEKRAESSERREENEELLQQLEQQTVKLARAEAESERVKKLYLEICAAKERVLAELATLRVEHTQQGSGQSSERLRNELDKWQQQVDQLTDELEKEREEKIKLMIRVHHMDDDGNISTGALDDSVTSEIDDMKVRLQQSFDVKLEQEVAKCQRRLKESEEMIKDETVKLFTADLVALEAKRNQAVINWQLTENKLAELELGHKELKKECDVKVMKLMEAEERFEKFQASCMEEIKRMNAQHSGKLERERRKYRRAHLREKHAISECKRVEDNCRLALQEVSRRSHVLLNMKVFQPPLALN